MIKTIGTGILKRELQEAQAIANKEFPDNLTIGQYSQLVGLLIDYSPLYCDQCYKTGTTIMFLGAPDLELITGDCRCKEFHRANDKIENGMEKAGIPTRYRQAAIGDWQNPGKDEEQIASNEKSLSIVKSYSDKLPEMHKKGYGLFFYGPNGIGKTYFACAIGANCIRNGFNLCYYTMPKIVQTVIGGWYEKDLQKTINNIELADFLIIDDLDKSYTTKTGIEISILDNLFRERLQNNRPMLVTSNKSLEQIKGSYGASVYSMVAEHCAEIQLVGQDYRGKISDGMLDDILEI